MLARFLLSSAGLERTIALAIVSQRVHRLHCVSQLSCDACHQAEPHGDAPGGKPNQDSFSTLINLDCGTPFGIFSVCDGHGPNGQVILEMLLTNSVTFKVAAGGIPSLH